MVEIYTAPELFFNYMSGNDELEARIRYLDFQTPKDIKTNKIHHYLTLYTINHTNDSVLIEEWVKTLRYSPERLGLVQAIAESAALAMASVRPIDTVQLPLETVLIHNSGLKPDIDRRYLRLGNKDYLFFWYEAAAEFYQKYKEAVPFLPGREIANLLYSSGRLLSKRP